MTESEAKIILEAEIVHHAECSIFAEALGMAIKALEKQIPKKPLQKSYMVKGAVVCPICEFVVLKADGYCSHCGQKLDWGDEE